MVTPTNTGMKHEVSRHVLSFLISDGSIMGVQRRTGGEIHVRDIQTDALVRKLFERSNQCSPFVSLYEENEQKCVRGRSEDMKRRAARAAVPAQQNLVWVYQFKVLCPFLLKENKTAATGDDQALEHLLEWGAEGEVEEGG